MPPSLPFILSLIITVTATSLPTPGYHRLKGSRLTRFHSTRGASEAGRAIAIELPAKLLAKKRLPRWKPKSRFVVFRHRGISYLVEGRSPYLAQAARKARKSPKGRLLVKGRVVRLRKATKTEKALWGVRVKTLQKTGRSSKGRLGRKRRKSA